uniref:Uncharacterized protein n=1 Tax=Pristionchus pacificus TaxID=54126 RepID=A0A2A6CWT3_PRIPA|eukprot:PDM82598.1 hypothetical protein PRIPAC_36991 [Pristionchus pacificus]
MPLRSEGEGDGKAPQRFPRDHGTKCICYWSGWYEKKVYSCKRIRCLAIARDSKDRNNNRQLRFERVVPKEDRFVQATNLVQNYRMKDQQADQRMSLLKLDSMVESMEKEPIQNDSSTCAIAHQFKLISTKKGQKHELSDHYEADPSAFLMFHTLSEQRAYREL